MFWKLKKSQGSRSGEYVIWWTVFIEFLALKYYLLTSCPSGMNWVWITLRKSKKTWFLSGFGFGISSRPFQCLLICLHLKFIDKQGSLECTCLSASKDTCSRDYFRRNFRFIELSRVRMFISTHNTLKYNL